LVGAGHEARDRACDQDAAAPALAHVLSDPLNEVDGAGHVGVDDSKNVIEVLIEKPFAQTASGVGQERLDRTSSNQCIELVDAFYLGKVGLQGIDLGSERFEILAGRLYLGLVRDNHQIEALLGTALGQFVADAG
jgi:hypothetical protein